MRGTQSDPVASSAQSAPTIIRQAEQNIAGLSDARRIATPASVVLISGGADTFDPAMAPELTQLIGRGIGWPAPSLSMTAPTRA